MAGLKDLKSLYDRHKRNVLGNTVGRPTGEGPNPANGDYFTDEGLSDSPFDSTRALKEDQLVKLLENNVKSNNHSYLGSPGSITYKPSPQNSPFQDMNGASSDYGEGFENPLTGNYDGRYIHPENGSTFD